jgi:hypothetical protein
MVLEKYISEYKDIFFKSIESINNQKVVFYTVFLICYFFLYFTIHIPQLLKDNDKNPLLDSVNLFRERRRNVIILFIIDAIYLSSYVSKLTYYYYNKDKYNHYQEFKIIISFVFFSSLLAFINIAVFSKELTFISDWKWTSIIFNITSSIFYVLFVILFLYNIEADFNIEFFLAIIILIFYMIEHMFVFTNGANQLYNKLSTNNFSTLTINCFSKNTTEKFDSTTTINNNEQLKEIRDEFGEYYLKTNGNIPISFINNKTNEYQDLILADFYYPGSIYSYLADSPLNGTPDLEALRIILADYNARFIHLDVYSSNTNNPFDDKAEPVIRCETMNVGSKPLSMNDTFSVINKWAWINNDNNNMSYPLFLYLNFNFDETNETIYLKIYEYLIKFFSKYFVDKKYSFCGRNSTFLISMAKLKECLGKIIIITNRYPTKCALDELINATASMNNKDKSLNNCVNLLEYKESYITFDKLGLSQDYDKTNILNNCRTNLTFFYTLPNKDNTTTSDKKAGLFNSSFQDCAQYGCQGTLMYIFIPDDNLNKWYSFFQNKNNFNPVLKHESLRYISEPVKEIVKQSPINGLQEPQKYTLIPGVLTTEKSNLSDSVTNKSN